MLYITGFLVFVPTALLNTFIFCLRAFVWGIDGAKVGSSGPKDLVPTPNKYISKLLLCNLLVFLMIKLYAKNIIAISGGVD